MKTTLLLLILSACSQAQILSPIVANVIHGGGSTPITHVSTQTASDASGMSVTSLAPSAATHTAGNALAVFIRYNASSAGIPVVSNTAADTWNWCPDSANGSDHARWAYAENINGNASDIVTLVPQLAGSGSSYVAMVVLEFANVAASSALDVCQGTTGTGTAIDSGTFTTTTASQVLLHGGVWNNLTRTVTPGSGYTDQPDANGMMAAEYKIVTSIQTGVIAEMDINSSQDWANSTISLKGI